MPNKPHEDGPSYHPVVATVSLGSHAIFHYYKYQNVESDVEESDSATAGRAIDPMPVLSLLLEPRSVVITGSDLYSCHLHGIESLEEDVFELRAGALQLVHGSGFATPIANEGLLGSQTLLKDGGCLRRDTRFSLTCRDVGRVASVKAFGRKLQ
jgi:alkylated DNA repair protein alkB homolog 6